MRLPVRRVHRAFPELDDYDDAQCRRFMTVACRRSGWRHLHRLIIAGVVLCTWVVLGLFIVGVLLRLARGGTTGVALIDRDDATLWIAAIAAAMLMFSALVTLVTRDFLLRRRLRQVLRGTGICPQCRYSLVGLVVPESLELPCPECGFLCRVDASLSVLAKGDGGTLAQHRIILDAVPFWTAARRRWWRRAALIAATALLLAVGVPFGLYEWRLREQAALARSDRPSEAFLRSAVERGRPGLELVAEPTALRRLTEIQTRILKLDAEHAPELVGDAAGGGVRVLDFHLDRDPPEDPPDDVAQSDLFRTVRDRQRLDMEIAIGLIGVYERNGIFAELESLRELPRQVRYAPMAVRAAFGAPLAHFGWMRQAARILQMRLLLAVERGDTKVAAASLEAILTIARVSDDQPFLIEQLVGSAIRAMAHALALRWLASNPDEAALDAIEAALKPVEPSFGVDLSLELESAMMLDYVAEFFGTPGNVRWAPLLPGTGLLTAATFGVGVDRPGSWIANRDFIRARSEVDRRIASLEFFERARANAPRQPTAPVEAGFSILLVNNILDACCRTADMRNLSERSIGAIIALERWRLRHGDYPQRLDELVPEFLRALPVDPWSGASLGYVRVDPALDPLGRAFLLYSAGPDRVDDGGQESIAERRPEFIQLHPLVVGAPHDAIINVQRGIKPFPAAKDAAGP